MSVVAEYGSPLTREASVKLSRSISISGYTSTRARTSASGRIHGHADSRIGERRRSSGTGGALVSSVVVMPAPQAIRLRASSSACSAPDVPEATLLSATCRLFDTVRYLRAAGRVRDKVARCSRNTGVNGFCL